MNLKLYDMCRLFQKLHTLQQISNCQVNHGEDRVFHSETRVFTDFTMYWAVSAEPNSAQRLLVHKNSVMLELNDDYVIAD